MSSFHESLFLFHFLFHEQSFVILKSIKKSMFPKCKASGSFIWFKVMIQGSELTFCNALRAAVDFLYHIYWAVHNETSFVSGYDIVFRRIQQMLY